MKNRIKGETDIDNAIKAFLEVGNERNRLVHQNYGTFSLEKDANEIYNLYLKARPFVEGLYDLMKDYLEHELQE